LLLSLSFYLSGILISGQLASFSPIPEIKSFPIRRGVLHTTLCDKVCKWLAAGWGFSQGPLVSSINKIDYNGYEYF
jgi:hypothetical protein